MAWSFLSKDFVNLINAPVIRKSEDYIAKLLRQQRPIEIQFPIQHRFSSFDNLVNFLEQTMKELNVILYLYFLSYYFINPYILYIIYDIYTIIYHIIYIIYHII